MDIFLKKKRIKRNFEGEIEPNEIFLDKIAQEKEGEFKKRFEVPIVPEKFFLLKIIFFIVLTILVGRSFYLQITEGEKFFNLAQSNKERNYFIRAKRGVVYDKNMEQLVSNESAYDLVLDKRDLPKKNEERIDVIKKISSLIGEDADSLFKRIGESELFVIPILENIPHKTLIVLEGKISELPGFSISENTVRKYLDESLSHTLGYMGKINEQELGSESNYSITDYIGRSGLEKYYENDMRGEPGKVSIEKDASGKKISEETISEPKKGNSLVLNIDFELQKKFESELKKSLLNVGAVSGVVIAIDPRTGGVLSLISLPSFDNNLFSKGISPEDWKEISEDSQRPLFNRAISGYGYPTGSIIKPLIGIAALEEGIINKSTTIYCPSEICVWNRYLEKDECFKDWTFHGMSNLKRAIAESVNTFFYIVGGGHEDFEGLGAKKIIKYLEYFNWGSETGIDIPGEGKGILPEIDESWRLGDTYHLSIGQGPFTATPIEVVTAFGAIANGGKLIEPRVVNRIIDASEHSKVIKGIKGDIIIDEFIDKDNIELVREGMRQTVTNGSAVMLNNLSVTSAAKTGTAESSKKGHYHHWISVFAPYKNPEIVFTIIIEDIEGVKSATLPMAREILNWYFSEN